MLTVFSLTKAKQRFAARFFTHLSLNNPLQCRVQKMQCRKIMACGESWKKLAILACQGFIFEFLECLCKTFSDINCIVDEKELILG